MRRFAYLLVVGLVVAACGGSNTATAGVDLVSASEAHDVIDSAPADLVVLDIRTPDEYNAGHLANSTNIDFYQSDFSGRLAELDRDATYVLYCNSGNRSAEAAKTMEDLGFTTVYEVDGGIQAWAQAGLPLTLD